MIHTMWNRKDDYMVMYLKIGKKDESLSENGRNLVVLEA
jgi:hypothetical protein